MDLIPTFSYETIADDKLTVKLVVNNITGSHFHYSNFTFSSASAGLSDSRDLSIDTDGTYTLENIELLPSHFYDDFYVKITIVDSFGDSSYDLELPDFSNGPDIKDLSYVLDPNGGSVTLN